VAPPDGVFAPADAVRFQATSPHAFSRALLPPSRSLKRRSCRAVRLRSAQLHSWRKADHPLKRNAGSRSANLHKHSCTVALPAATGVGDTIDCKPPAAMQASSRRRAHVSCVHRACSDTATTGS
jgi:hypothetical protein